MLHWFSLIGTATISVNDSFATIIHYLLHRSMVMDTSIWPLLQLHRTPKFMFLKLYPSSQRAILNPCSSWSDFQGHHMISAYRNKILRQIYFQWNRSHWILWCSINGHTTVEILTILIQNFTDIHLNFNLRHINYWMNLKNNRYS